MNMDKVAGSLAEHFVNERWARLNLPQGKWVEVSMGSLDSDEERTIWDLYSLSYGDIGRRIPSLSAFLSKYKVLRLIDVDADGSIDAFLAYKKTPFGNKLTLMGTDGSRAAKSAVIRYGLQMVKSSGWYAEASGKLIKILEGGGVPRVTDEQAVRAVMRGKEIFWLGDGEYTRKLKGLGKVRKIMYGHPRV